MPLILPVIHYLNASQALSQAALALSAGADGVFLLSHHGEDTAVCQAAKQLRWSSSSNVTAAGAAPFIGINLLNTAPTAAYEIALQLGVQGLWLDAPGVNSHGPARQALKLSEQIKAHPGLQVFGSVAFKYQPEEPDPPAAAREALALGMLPTTSGDATGVAPSVEKVRAMSLAAGGQLAVASGMTPANVSAYAPLVSHLLVATGVSTAEDGYFDATKLRAFVAAARG